MRLASCETNFQFVFKMTQVCQVMRLHINGMKLDNSCTNWPKWLGTVFRAQSFFAFWSRGRAETETGRGRGREGEGGRERERVSQCVFVREFK